MTSQPPHGTGSWRPEQHSVPVSGPGRSAMPHAAPAPMPPVYAAPAGGPWTAPPPPTGARKHGWYLVIAAAVLGVLVFCGIVVAAAGNQDKPAKTEDVARNGALGAPISDAPASSPATTAFDTQTTTAPAPTTAAAAPTTAPTTAAGAPGAKPTTKPPATKPATTRPATKPTTKPPTQNCNPNYSPCVPNDPVDVDCAGGSGNGPSYVQGPVQVIGSDPYGLDTDHDGIGCE
ncbi:hypothetical protein [Dactylosporangium sp. NPDC049140]|uniref:hypothetical protein n=1 Tax=Dactylosporangium sp. NPDC049140 TaxID=3155647 RepID=UPI0033E3D418